MRASPTHSAPVPAEPAHHPHERPRPELPPASARSSGWRPTINITPAERASRILIGTAVAITAVVLLTSAGSVLAVVLEVLLGAAGVDLVVTGALGHCPLYRKLGYMPRSMRSA